MPDVSSRPQASRGGPERSDPASRALSLVLVDDHPAIRSGLSALLEAEGGFIVLAAVPSAREGLAAIERLRPDVALLDFHLPEGDGLSLCVRVRGLPKPPRVVVVSAFADETLALQAEVAGADGLAAKDSSARELCEAVRAVARGERRLPPVTRAVLEAQAGRLDPEDLPILAMLRARVPFDEIAATLRVEPAWLRTRRWAILGRLGVRDGRRLRPARPRRLRALPGTPPGADAA